MLWYHWHHRFLCSALLIAWILPMKGVVWLVLCAQKSQNIKTFSYCCCYFKFYGVLDGEFTESFWWGLGVWLYRNFCIATYHRSLGWSEHTLGGTYRAWVTGSCGALNIPHAVKCTMPITSTDVELCIVKDILQKTIRILLIRLICHYWICIPLHLPKTLRKAQIIQ